MHICRDDLPLSLLFRPRPTLTDMLRSVARLPHLPRPRSNPPRVDRAPPRGVTVFADRQEQPYASTPQKQRRHFPPLRLWVHVSRLLVPPTHAPSRRLQRVPCRARPLSAGNRRAGAPPRRGCPPAPRRSLRRSATTASPRSFLYLLP